VQSGVATYFMPGNRDFLVGQAFADATGCNLLSDPSIIDLYGTKVLLAHGDSLCTDDRMHQIFRAITAMPWLQRLYLKQPFARRLAIAQKFRLISKNRTRSKSIVKMDTVDKAILKILGKYQVSCIIHGHTHRPGIEFFNMNEQSFQRIVLSDWDALGNALICEPDGGKRLVYFGVS
jgi:UDP-2,3-diacylglucosamine hydrolase